MGDVYLDQPTTENANVIAPINKDVVHRICSGQVVLSLAIAVKELVENSLDAGATLVEVRLKEHGIDLVEVSDNGCGVVEDNFAALALKYHTSKLRDFSDLVGIRSFGFRGEALSSLCALSEVRITTRHHSSEYATRISYDHKGYIKKTTPCSRQVGTTVTLSKLFETLPVRQKEFQKNVKREFAKMTQILYAYCLVSAGVKIICTNQTRKGTKSVVVATQGSQSVRDNIACVFGMKQLDSLMELKLHNPRSYIPNLKDKLLTEYKKEDGKNEIAMDDVIEDIDNDPIDLSDESEDVPSSIAQSSQADSQISDDNILSPSLSLIPDSQEICNMKQKADFDFSGFISSCAHGAGRSTSDRQFYYVNSRPCEPTKIMKLINELYRQYNSNQYPFIFLNLNIKGSAVDVNVTPDKRQVFLDREKNLLEVLKVSLLKMYQNVPSTLAVENEDLNNRNNVTFKTNGGPNLSSFLTKFANKTLSTTNAESNTECDYTTDKKRKLKTLDSYISTNKIPKVANVDDEKEKDSKFELINLHVQHSDPLKTIEIKFDNDTDNDKESSTEAKAKIDNFVNQANVEMEESSTDTSFAVETLQKKEVVYLSFGDNLPDTQIRTVDEVISSNTSCSKAKVQSVQKCNSIDKVTSTTLKTTRTDDGTPSLQKKAVILKTSIEYIKSLLTNFSNGSDKPLNKVKFKATIRNGTNKTCEQELQKELSKEMFQKMRIIGQFNLGFIITELDNDLFIVDQHATDEKYNFETLQKTTVLTNQKLVVPQQLELTGVNEQILMNNLEIFKKNGFTFEIDEDAPATKKVKLLTIPISNNWVFGKDDIEELLFMLKEAEPSETCRPSRVRAMFASRACRKSVMIGMALAKSDMRKLIDHMGMIEQPWNCPHGRPTIRHLVNLSLTKR